MEGAGKTSSHAGQIAYYYTDYSHLKVLLSTGNEVENLGPGRGILNMEIFHTGLGGPHWFSKQYVVTYLIDYHQQGSSYNKIGIQMGIRYKLQ